MSLSTKILLTIRNRTATDWPSLCRHFGVDPNDLGTPTFLMRRALFDLRTAGLVAFDTQSDPGSARFMDFENLSADHSQPVRIAGTISVTPYWERIQTALDISLAQVAKLERNATMIISPYFGTPRRQNQEADVFVLMPFNADMKPIYDDHMKKVAEKMKLTIKRADDFFGSNTIMSDIWNAICAAKVVIADCTGRNPNVFYEIGLTHTLGRPVVFITQNSDDVPFDIRHIRYIEYAYTPRGMIDFETRLETTISTLLNE